METVQTIQTKDYIIQAIRKEILSGNIRMGEEITQESIAEALGVSRMPVREAFQALAQEGFLLRLPNRHMQVTGMEARQVLETFRIAAVMETELFLLLTREERDGLKPELEMLYRAAAEEKKAVFYGAELSFHRIAVKKLDNPYIQLIFSKFLDGYISYSILNLPRETEAAVRELKEIEDALFSGEEVLLRERFEAYYKAMAEHLLTHMEEAHESYR